jgi:hypothetical protein
MPTPPPSKLSTPAKRRQATAASGSGAGIGLVALIAGLVLHAHYGPIKQVCDSGIGTLGQALDPSAQHKCSLDSLLAEVGTIATVVGAVILAGVLLTVVGLVLEARQATVKPAGKSAATTSGHTQPLPRSKAATASNLAPTRTDSSTTASRETET